MTETRSEVNGSGRLDPRWEWAEVSTFDGTVLACVKVGCNHLEVVPVESGGEVVANLCQTCDTQLPGEWSAA